MFLLIFLFHIFYFFNCHFLHCSGLGVCNLFFFFRCRIHKRWNFAYKTTTSNRKLCLWKRKSSKVISRFIADFYYLSVQIKKIDIYTYSCTGDLQSEECSREYSRFNILPPVLSAQITTEKSFSFRYGKITIKAKMPSGDWIVPRKKILYLT